MAYIIDAIRTPIGRYGGGLAQVRADDLGAAPIKALLERNPTVPTAAIEDVVLGCANQAGEDNRNVARMSLLLAGLPISVPGLTVNRLCGSGMSGVLECANAVANNSGELFIAGGVESMTRAPYVMGKSEKPYGRSPELFDTTLGWRFVNPRLAHLYGVHSMGETAENLASERKISREAQDQFSFLSQQKAAAAQRAGRFEREIFGVTAGKSLFERDEYLRPETTLEALSQLKPAFVKDGSVTAGNSSGINDGACALLLASERAVKLYNLRPRGRVVGGAVAGVEPRIMGIGPVAATKKLLERSKLTLDQMAVIELNEAFAAQALACLQELNLAADDPRVNPLGGAIALGHPLGMSGARLITTALNQLEVSNEQYALCTMCIGVGQGISCIIERV